MRVAALIPVYNNARTIADVVCRARAVLGDAVIVVADGSEDGSDEAAREAGAQVLRLPQNLGKGEAIRRGLFHAQAASYSHAAVLDADGQHCPEDLPRLIEAARGAPDRIWIGVRQMSAQGIPRSSRRGRAISNFWTTVDGWQRCRDAQCGFRVYPISKTLALNCREMRFAFEMEVLIRGAWAGVPFGHVDIEVVYPEQRVSFFDMRRDNLAFSWLSFKLFWGMIARSPVLAYRRLAATKARQT